MNKFMSYGKTFLGSHRGQTRNYFNMDRNQKKKKKMRKIFKNGLLFGFPFGGQIFVPLKEWDTFYNYTTV